MPWIIDYRGEIGELLKVAKAAMDGRMTHADDAIMLAIETLAWAERERREAVCNFL
jgi:hypothetical protein